MKKLSYLILFLFTALTSCSDDDKYTLSVSTEQLTFTPEGGEQVVQIASNGTWDCNYSEDWLLVRQKEDRIRVIADANNTDKERKALIQLTLNNHNSCQIAITQGGISMEVKKTVFETEFEKGDFLVPVSCNSAWTVENSNEWINIEKGEKDLKVLVAKNITMKNRQGEFSILSGNVSQKITVKQAACPWYHSFELITVEGGSFYMGAQKTNPDYPNFDKNAFSIEAPVHKVSLDGYKIGKFEVTQEQWTAAMGNNPSQIQGEKLPVTNVSWSEVQEFILLLNKETRLNYRLPTEAEWEFAAKGGTKSTNCKYSGLDVLGACGWFYSNSEDKIHEVGGKLPNELGIYDMSGNAREWCADWFDYYNEGNVANPIGPESGMMRINRGGSWMSAYQNCRNTYRQMDSPESQISDLGFRLVLLDKQ